MSLSSALSVALSGLRVSTSLLQIASNNIANAQTAGYTEKGATTDAVDIGDEGGGVSITGYTRTSNSALTSSLNNATTQAGLLNQENTYFGQVQALLGSNSSNPPLSSAMAAFQSAWTQYSSEPESSAAQQTVIQAGVNLAGQIQSIAQGVTTLQAQATSDLATNVKTLNTDLQQVATLNGQIANAASNNQPTGDLQDQLDQTVNSIASITGVTVFQRQGGQEALYTPGGLLLVDGSTAQNFTFSNSTITSASGQDVTNELSGGSLEAQVNFLYGSATSADPGTGVINKLNSALQALTNSLTTTTGTPQTFAAAYNGATTQTGELDNSFFTTDVAVDPGSIAVNANLLNGTNTLKQASGTPVANALSAARSLSSGFVTSASGSYTDFGTAILSAFQQGANAISTQSTAASQQQSYYQQALASATGVNVDTELVNLTALQNSYAASAHVITTINAMLADLENVLP